MNYKFFDPLFVVRFFIILFLWKACYVIYSWETLKSFCNYAPQGQLI